MIGRMSLFAGLLCVAAASAQAPLQVTGIAAVHRHGQTFVTWKDVAEGEAGARFRYTLLRSTAPIKQENLGKAQVCATGILHHSGRMFGSAFNRKDRLDAEKPMAILETGGKPLPVWSGLAVHTVQKPGPHYYAVIATDEKGDRLSDVVAGKSATSTPIEEKVAPLEPIKVFDSKERKTYVAQTHLTGKKGLPLHLSLHGSTGQGGGAGEWGDSYLHFANADMGYRDGLPGVFSILETRRKEGNHLQLMVRDAIEHPSGLRAMETFWFGYWCVPQNAKIAEPRAYPFTENRLLWILDWTIEHYGADRNRLYASGGSMGAWGSVTFALRHPELFAAIYPNRPGLRRKGLAILEGKLPDDRETILLPDGKTNFLHRMDSVRFAEEHAEDLPFIGWCCGRYDGFATWKEQVDFAKALAANKHGFAFAWNNGNHGTGAQPMAHVLKHYPAEKFALNRSYPAFRNSSIDQNPGNGDPKDGDLEGGINLGFTWTDPEDSDGKWSIAVGNDLAKKPMTVDVTPRRAQKFKLKAGEACSWTSSHGASGEVVADKHGLVTVPRLEIREGQATTLKIVRK